MLTYIKQIFTWWNRQTLGTALYTLFFGKFVGKDNQGNKYYQNKKGKRWVIYSGEIDASKIPHEWFSWIHFTNNKLENLHKFKKYEWQKPHQANQTGTKQSYHPNSKKNENKKKYDTWKS